MYLSSMQSNELVILEDRKMYNNDCLLGVQKGLEFRDEWVRRNFAKGCPCHLSTFKLPVQKAVMARGCCSAVHQPIH